MRGFILVVVVGLATACGSKSVFRLSSDDNNTTALREALAQRRLPDRPTPVNVSGHPRVFVLAAGSPPSGTKTIIAYDLESGNVMWKTDADVQSRIAVGGDFIVALEGTQLVARDQARGAPRWKVDIDGAFVGTTADRERAYLVAKDGNTWMLRAFDGGSGEELWDQPSNGLLGAPTAQGGVLYVPFLSQWLTIVDGTTGEQLARLRGIDEQISVVRATSTVAYYGSRQGVFRLDERSASGRRSDASYGQVKIPPQLDRTTYGAEAYDLVQQGYTANDRARVLWASEPTATGPMKLVGGGYAIHYFRYLLGFGENGALRWAYSHPRVELVASEHTGTVIAGVSTSGDIVAVEPQTGAVRARKSLGIAAQVIGATFDADGWSPTSENEEIETVAALVTIARDRDARFDRVKELAVNALAQLPGPQVTSELLAVIADERAPQKLKDTVVELLVARRDPASLPVLAQQLDVKDDYIAQTNNDSLGSTAKAIAGLAGTTPDPAHAAAALAALAYHLDAPSTAMVDLVEVIAAMTAVGGGAEKPILTSHLLLYHADDERGGDAAWQKAIATAVARNAGPLERQALRYVVADPRTRAGLTVAIHEAIGDD